MSATTSTHPLIGTSDTTSPRLAADLVGTRTGDSADDPVTGPLPAVADLDGRLQVHTRRDVVVVALDGGLDVDLATQVAPRLAPLLAASPASVLDLDQVTLLDQAGMDLLAAAFVAATDGAERCIVASRLSGRLVLERWGFASSFAVFTSCADALQARAFASSGYGPGWSPG